MFNLSKIFVTLFYIGYFKFIPGSIASFFSLIIICLLNNFFDKIYLYSIFTICFFLSIFLVNIYQKTTTKIDPAEIVIDEFLGIFIIVIFYDYFINLNFYTIVILSFILFRFFDIYKPFPINLIDKKIKNSFGVIFDDILAGIYSVICLMVINEVI